MRGRQMPIPANVEATDRADLRAKMEVGRADWEALVASVGDERMELPGAEGHWSVRDIVAHVTLFDRFTAGLLTAAIEGREAEPRELYDVADLAVIPEGVWQLPLDERNEVFRSWYAPLPLDELLALSRRAHDDLLATVDRLSDEQLLTPGWLPQAKDRSLLEIIPYQCYRHYHTHAPAIERWAAEAA